MEESATGSVKFFSNFSGAVNASIGAKRRRSQRLGMTGWIGKKQTIENQLARYGVKAKDVRYILHTHNHIDHAGQDDKFPMTTTVCMQRKELEHSGLRLDD